MAEQTEQGPKVLELKREQGIAGQYAIRATVQYPMDKLPYVCEFIGSVYGGPVVTRMAGIETFVSDPGRFGEFGETWVRRYFGEEL